MQKRPVLRRVRGATILVAWQIDEDTENQLDENTVVRSALKKVPSAQSKVPDDRTEEAAEFDVLYVPAVGDQPAYFHCKLPAPQSELLDLGFYLTDLRFDFDGFIPQVQTVALDIRDSVTGATA